MTRNLTPSTFPRDAAALESAGSMPRLGLGTWELEGATATRAVVAALIRKDLRLELRTRESVPAMALFSISTFVLFHFGLDARSLEGDLAAGVLWVTLLFASVLAINRLFVGEREEGGFDGFLLAPAQPCDAERLAPDGRRAGTPALIWGMALSLGGPPCPPLRRCTQPRPGTQTGVEVASDFAI